MPLESGLDTKSLRTMLRRNTVSERRLDAGKTERDVYAPERFWVEACRVLDVPRKLALEEL